MKILTEAPLFAKQRGAGGEFICSGFSVKRLVFNVKTATTGSKTFLQFAIINEQLTLSIEVEIEIGGKKHWL